MPKSPYRPFIPKPEQMALKPATSGNTINGQGERKKRQARPIYWHDPESLSHGEMQKWFYTQNPDNPAIAKARADRAKILDIEVPEVHGEPVHKTSEQWTQELTSFAEQSDFELFGVTQLQKDWFFEGQSRPQKWVIMVGVAHSYEEIIKAPKDEAGAEVVRQYGRGAKAVKDIATWIRQQGWDAEPQAGPMAGPLLLIPPAIACGFGELGRHGSIINKDYGSSFRLAGVLTDLPLVETKPETYGVDDFCSRCQVCSNACPPDAILPNKQWVRGEQKRYVDFDKCIPFFNENFGCGICIAVCPWSRPGRGPRIVEQLIKRGKKQ